MANCIDRVKRDARGFLYVDGVKICRVTPEGGLEFFDKDRRRAAQRGANCVQITIVELAAVVVPPETNNQ